MASPQSSLIIKKWDGFGGNFIDAQYLGHSYDAQKPFIFENTLQRIYSAKNRFFTDPKVLSEMVSATTVEIDNDIYRWTLQGADFKSARVLEVVEGSAAPGINGTTFRIKLDLNYFASPDVIIGEDNEYPLEIVNGPIQDGTGYIYEVRIQTDSPTIYFPVSELALGKRFDKAWTSVVNEMNDEGGTQQAPASFMLESQIGMFAQKLTVISLAA